jgi:hypothetical protein
LLEPLIFNPGTSVPYAGDKMTLVYNYRSNTGFIEGASLDRKHIVIEKIFVFGDDSNSRTFTSFCDGDCSDILFKLVFEALDKKTQNYISKFPHHSIRVERGPDSSMMAYTANIYLAQKDERYADFELLEVDFNINYNPTHGSIDIESLANLRHR